MAQSEWFDDKDHLIVWEFYQVTSHDNTSCDENCAGYIDYPVMQFRGEDETENYGPVLKFAEPDDDDLDEWYVYNFYYYECDMAFRLLVE